jgi:hypothetical protein
MTAFTNGLQHISQHKVATAAGVGLIGAGAATAYVISRNKSKKRSKKNKRTTRKSFRRYRKQKQPHTAGKRKDTSHRRIRYTKNNQPYIILASGKARFISNKSAGNSRRRKGGRY